MDLPEAVLFGQPMGATHRDEPARVQHKLGCSTRQRTHNLCCPKAPTRIHQTSPKGSSKGLFPRSVRRRPLLTDQVATVPI